MRARRHVWITGIVQGVNFRRATAEEAQRSGVGGWVRNLPDGRVEAIFEGEPAAVDHVLQWCKKGPPGARVTGLHHVEEPAKGDKEFQVHQ